MGDIEHSMEISLRNNHLWRAARASEGGILVGWYELFFGRGGGGNRRPAASGETGARIKIPPGVSLLAYSLPFFSFPATFPRSSSAGRRLFN